jgi:NADH:ubiquinone oxidoreductase subunit 4 (subunit M)
MIAWTIYLTFVGAVVLLVLSSVFARWIALLTAIAGLVLGIVAFVCTPVADLAHFMTIVSVPWVPALGMNYHLAVDGVSLTMVLVTGISAVSTVLFSWDVDQRQREFFFWLLLVVEVLSDRHLRIDQQGVRRDEADSLLVLRRDVRFCRHSRRLCDSRLSGSESTGAIPL